MAVIKRVDGTIICQDDNLYFIELFKKHLKESGDFRRADFRYSNFRYSNFSDSDFRGADFSYSNFSYSDFRGVDFRYSDFSYSDFRGADFRGVDFRGVDFRYSDFRSSDFLNSSGVLMQCPEEGSFIGYKKCNNYIVKLLILEDARRSSGTTDKCRCDKAKVLEIQNLDGSISDITTVYSNFDCSFEYTVGKIVTEPNFCTDRWSECAEGIHFFINRKNAVNY